MEAKEVTELVKRLEIEINKTPTGELRNLLCDANITILALAMPAVIKSLPYKKVIKDRADYFRKIMHKYEAKRLEDCLRTIKELIPPENWNIGNGA